MDLRIVRFGGGEERLETDERGTDGEDGGPLIFQDVETYESLQQVSPADNCGSGDSLRGNVWMIDFCYEPHFRRFERILIRDLNVNFVHSACYTHSVIDLRGDYLRTGS